MKDPQVHYEEFYQALIAWASLEEFRQLLREVQPDELVTLMQVAKRLDLIAEPAQVERRIQRIEGILEAHAKWEQRRKDFRDVAQIIGVVFGAVLSIWVAFKTELLALWPK
jgi:hypothetical protein